MSERILLTDEEYVAFRNALSEAHAHGANYTATIQIVMDAINRVRVGDPVGTIRRTDGGVIALRVDGGDYPWKAFTRTGAPAGTWTNKQVSNWAVIFTPEVS